MQSTNNPWEANWEVVQDLSGGGQGSTKLVIARDPSLGKQPAVLKILKRQQDSEARRRMFREVGNLKTLHTAGCRVPRVIESNVDSFEILEIPLYFAMERVVGDTLEKVVAKHGGLPLPDAIKVSEDLALSLRTALREQIIHRDLKPENIMVREVDASSTARFECTILDYGLSFNSTMDENLTRVSETLDNSFLSLPERRIPGGDRRDPRSDITGLCGILYFCITGHHPVDLVGPDNRAPHHRPKYSIREKLGESIQVRVLESFLDRGFSPNLESRFQTIDEFLERLDEVLHPRARAVREDPVAAAKRAARALVEGNRQSQIAAFQRKAGHITQPLHNCYNKFRGQLAPFELTNNYGLKEAEKRIEGYEPVGVEVFFTLTSHPHQARVTICYQVMSKAFDCAVFRGLVTFKDNRYELAEPWQPVIRYDGREDVDFSILEQDLEATITEAINALQRAILGVS